MSVYDDPVMEATLAMLLPPSFDDIDMISYLDATFGTNVSYDDKSPLHDLPIIYRLENNSYKGSLDAVKEALAELRRLPETERRRDNPYGRALLWAVEQGHQDVVAYLLSEAVEPSTSVVRKAILMKITAMLQLLEKAWDINKAFGWSEPPALAQGHLSALSDVLLTENR